MEIVTWYQQSERFLSHLSNVSGQLGLRQVQGEVHKSSGKFSQKSLWEVKVLVFFSKEVNWILSKETDSEDLHWSWFHDRLGSLTLKIMWGIFCLGSGGCLAVDTVVAVLVRPVLAMHSPVSPHRRGLQKIIPQSDKWLKWNDHFYISRIQRKRFLLSHALMHYLYHRVPHWALSGPPGVDGDTQQAGLGQVSKVKLPIESSNCIQSLNMLSCLLKIPIAHQRSLFSWLSAINALDFDEKTLRNLKASQFELPVAGTDAGVPWPKF